MGKTNKDRRDKDDIPQFRKNLKAKCAGGAARTAGLSRVFDDKFDKQSKARSANTGDPEIDEGIDEYNERKGK